MPHIVPWRQYVAVGGAHVLRAGPRRHFPSLGGLRGPDSEGCKPH
jgi:hypothetical protein